VCLLVPLLNGGCAEEGLLGWLTLLSGAHPGRQDLVLVAALQRIGGHCRQPRAWVQGGGDLYRVLGVDGFDGFDPEGLGAVEEHGEGAGSAVVRDGEEGHGLRQLLSCW